MVHSILNKDLFDDLEDKDSLNEQIDELMLSLLTNNINPLNIGYKIMLDRYRSFPNTSVDPIYLLIIDVYIYIDSDDQVLCVDYLVKED